MAMEVHKSKPNSSSNCLNRFLNNESDNIPQKLSLLGKTLQSIESECYTREKSRLDDLQLVLNNVYASKGVYHVTRDYRRKLWNQNKQLSKQVAKMEQTDRQLLADIVVNERRFHEFRTNVVSMANESHWEMNRLCTLLQDEEDDDSDGDECGNDIGTFCGHIEFSNFGRLGLQLNEFKHAMIERNSTLDEFAREFARTRFVHAMYYHHDKDSYWDWRRTADLTSRDLDYENRRNSLSQESNSGDMDARLHLYSDKCNNE